MLDTVQLHDGWSLRSIPTVGVLRSGRLLRSIAKNHFTIFVIVILVWGHRYIRHKDVKRLFRPWARGRQFPQGRRCFEFGYPPGLNRGKVFTAKS